MFDDCKYSYYGEKKLVNPRLDVEHATEDSGQAQHAMSLPRLHYEGFEPSPYDKNDSRAETDEGLVRIVCSLAWTEDNKLIHRKPFRM